MTSFHHQTCLCSIPGVLQRGSYLYKFNTFYLNLHVFEEVEGNPRKQVECPDSTPFSREARTRNLRAQLCRHAILCHQYQTWLQPWSRDLYPSLLLLILILQLKDFLPTVFRQELKCARDKKATAGLILAPRNKRWGKLRTIYLWDQSGKSHHSTNSSCNACTRQPLSRLYPTYKNPFIFKNHKDKNKSFVCTFQCRCLQPKKNHLEIKSLSPVEHKRRVKYTRHTHFLCKQCETALPKTSRLSPQQPAVPRDRKVVV